MPASIIDGNLNITVVPNGTVYFGTESGLYYSTDGINFQLVNGTEFMGSPTDLRAVTVAPNGTVYAYGDGLWYSTDGINFKMAKGLKVNGGYLQTTWEPVYLSNGNVDILGNYGVYYSTDGINFKMANGIPAGKMDNIDHLVVAPNGNVYAGGDGLWYSTDGMNFQQVNGITTGNSINGANLVVAPNGNVLFDNFSDTVTNNYIYYSTDGINFQQVNGIPAGNIEDITNLVVAPNGNVLFNIYYDYLHQNNYVYYSTDGINFQQVNGIPAGKMEGINNLVVAPNGSFYVTTDTGLYIVGMLNNLISFNLPNYYLNNQFIYDKPTNISISDAYLQNASLDGKSLTLPTKNLNLGVGKHNLTLTLKDEYKQYASFYGGNNTTGVVNYNFWIKDTIADNQYSTNDDTTLYQGLVSNAGNTNGSKIIQTSNNQGSSHPAELNVTLQDKLLDLSKSYYVSGTVDTNNDFTATGSKVFLINNQFTVKNDGIYQLHLVDKVGNNQDTYLELGQDNWKLKGTFNDKTFDILKTELNVTVDVTGQDKEKQAMAWLNQYKIDSDNTFTAEAKKYAAGFNITVADLPDSYITFLDSTTYTDQGGTEKININELDNAIKNVVQNKINSGLSTVSNLTKKYNISTSNVIDSNSLNSYVSWINNYDSWFNKNETTILTNEINKVSHGYASQSEIKNILANINISNIFNNVNWNVKTDSNYQQFINYQNLDQAILKADSSQTWEAQYQADLKIQESNLNLHGYTIAQILGNKQEPQTKSQMENYDNSGESFHSWLQTEANSKYHKYQLDTGLEIGLPLFVLVSLISLTWYYRHTKKYKLFVFKRTNVKNKEKVDD